MPTRAAPFPNARTPESPLMMAKALVSTINSEYADINDIKSKLMVLEGVMDVLDNKNQLRSQRSEQLGRYFDEVKSESSGTSRYSNTNSEIRCESPSANNVKRM